MGRKGKGLRPVRKAEEFARALRSIVKPHTTPTAQNWNLEQIRAAIRDQQLGRFRMPSRLSKSMRSDDALMVAYRNRLAPLRALPVEVKAAAGAKGKAIAKEADALYGPKGAALTPETVTSIHGDLVDHAVAFACLDRVVRDDGSRVDLYVRHWPIEWVDWDPTFGCYVTQTRDQGRVPITHGDGQWIVFKTREVDPFAYDGCLPPAGLVWAGRAFPLRDWQQNSQAHGAAKMFGELPEGVALADENGNATPEAAAFLELLESVMSGSSLAGLRPYGAKTEFVANGGTNWQVFSELVTNRTSAAARIYLGTDGTLGAQGGAPGVDISALFGILTTLMQGDVGNLTTGFHSGLVLPWTAMNWGDSTHAPTREWVMPDPDAERVHADFSVRDVALHDALARRRDAGMVVDQAVVDALAATYGIDPPTLAPSAEQGVKIDFAPTDVVNFVRAGEARRSMQLPLFGDARDDLTVGQLREKAEAAGDAPPVAPRSNGAASRGVA